MKRCSSAAGDACGALAAERLQWRAAAVASDRSGRSPSTAAGNVGGRDPSAAEAATPAGAAVQDADLDAHLSRLSLGRAGEDQSAGAAAGKVGAAPRGYVEGGSELDKGTGTACTVSGAAHGDTYSYDDVCRQQDQGCMPTQGWQGPAARQGLEGAACAMWQAEGATAHWGHPQYGQHYGQQQGEPQLQRASQQHCSGYQLQHNGQGWGPGQDQQALQQQSMWAVSGSWLNGQQQQRAPPPSDDTR